MKVLHYNNQFNSNPLHSLMSDFGESNTDTSSWRPELSIIHAQASGATRKRFLYDFPDGKDNGESVQTFIRSKGLDVTEIDSALKSVTESTNDKIKEAKLNKKSKDLEKESKEAEIKAIGDSVANAINNGSADSIAK